LPENDRPARLAGARQGALNRPVSPILAERKVMRYFISLLVLVLAGCSSTGSNDGSKMPSRRDAERVRIVEAVPEKIGRFSNLSATLCRGEGPMAPSRDNALLLLKMRSFQNGYLLLHSVTVGSVRGSLADSCKGGFQAKGVGFSSN
jgi:hypothetical protein